MLAHGLYRALCCRELRAFGVTSKPGDGLLRGTQQSYRPDAWSGFR
jgi:hypothetical protein